MGNTDYMSTEQASGRDDIDGRTDLCAGVMLVPDGHGRLPSMHPTHRAILMHIQAPVPSARRWRSDLPAGLNRSAAGDGKQREDRYATAA